MVFWGFLTFHIKQHEHGLGKVQQKVYFFSSQTIYLKNVQNIFSSSFCGHVTRGPARVWRHLHSHINHCETWPLGKTRRIGYRVDLQFAFHTRTTQTELLCTDAFTTVTNPQHYSGERWSSRVQHTEAGSDVLTSLRRSQDFVCVALTPSSALITTNMCHHFLPREISFLFFKCLYLSRDRSFIISSQSSYTVPEENVWRISGVQCTSKVCPKITRKKPDMSDNRTFSHQWPA